MTDIDIKIQYHTPDQNFAAVFIRDSQPWYLDGALVGMGATPAEAVLDLCEIAEYLVIHGENFLTDGPLPRNDRAWLFTLLDHATENSRVNEMYAALRNAFHSDSAALHVAMGRH